MRRQGSLAARGRRWLPALALALAGCLAVVAAREARAPRRGDAWTALVQAGDALARGARPGVSAPGRPVTPRAAYLLAFHVAQDAGDPEHALAVADRLDALGEPDLATHVRRATERLLAEPDVAGPAAVAAGR
jgi:hypothetical protein